MSETPRTTGRLEVLVAILIGLTSLATIVVTFESSLHSQVAGSHQSNYDTLMLDASTEHQVGYIVYLADTNVWLRIQELQARSTFPTDAEARTTVETLVNREFSQAFRAAFDDWVHSPSADGRRATPDFSDVWYATSLFAGERADKAEAESQRHLAASAQERSGRLALATIVFSVALFLSGIVSAMRLHRARMVLLGAAIAVDLVGFAIVAMVPLVWPI